MNKILYHICFLILFFCSCEKNIENESPFVLNLQNGFPNPEIPSDNQLTWDRIALGKKLFYDPILSIDRSVSCGSCHKQQNAFADNTPVSTGVENRIGTRNTLSLANVAYHDYFLREGSVPSLEMQILVPIQEHNEMGFNIVAASERLNLDSSYVQASMNAYNRIPDPYVITRAIASFERTMISSNSSFDTNNLNESEKRGKELFFSEELACANCHGTFLFTNQKIENNGLYEIYSDSGRYRLTQLNEDIGKFKTPTLRNIEITGPYMHDGSMNTLEEVIEHYANGGKNHFNKSEQINGFFLSDSEKNDLIHFLKSLTDDEFLENTFFEE